MERIEEILWDKTTDKLANLCKIAQIKGSAGTKAYRIEKLCEFYRNENWVKETFEKLTNYEKDMMKCIIQNKYHPSEEDIEEVLEKYKKKIYMFDSSYFDRDSKTKLFYIERGSIPREFKIKLNKLVEPLKVEIKETKDKIDPEEFYANIIGREDRVQDFNEFIKFINVSKIKATKAKGQMPKSGLIKIHNKIQYKDVLRNDEIEFDSIRGIEDTIVSNGIINLLRNSLIVRIKKEEFVIEELFCKDYQKLNKVEKIQYLLNAYIKKESIFINECERIQSGNFRIQNKVPEFGEVRQIILEYLKKCPIEKWIDMSEFKKQIRIHKFRFLRPYTGEVLIKDQYYGSYYNDASHNEFENPFIDIVFMEYLATLGIVDVVISQDSDDYGYKEFLTVDYFKLTKLGSYVLEMAQQEIIENDEEEITINENFEIIIEETNQKLKYELYFDRFLTKKSEKPLIYKLDFKGMVKALELGIKFKEIYEFLQTNCKKGIPSNVKAKIENWIQESKKIKIKTITVLEVDGNNFKEIVSNEDYKDYIESIRREVIVLKSNKAEQMKKELNKNGKFCI